MVAQLSAAVPFDTESLDLPEVLTEGSIDEFLLKCASIPGVADLTLQTDDYAWAKVNNVYRPVSHRRLETTEIEMLAAWKYGSSALAKLMSGEDLNFRCEVQRSLRDVVTFRANVTRGRIGPRGDGLSATLRFINELPRPLDSLGLENSILEAICPQYGLVLVVGTTGSGKSTILSSVIDHRQRSPRPMKIGSYEDPIEFTFGRAGDRIKPLVFQAEIGKGRHLNEFGQAAPNAMRRGFDALMVGEVRDKESAEAAFDLAMTGHAVYATMHVETPSQVIDRMTSFFPFDAQPSAASKLRAVLRLVVAQKQFNTTDGRSQRARSWCVFDRAINDEMSKARYTEWQTIVDATCSRRDTAFENRVLPMLERGEISLETFCEVSGMTGYEAREYLAGKEIDVSRLD